LIVPGHRIASGAATDEEDHEEGRVAHVDTCSKSNGRALRNSGGVDDKRVTRVRDRGLVTHHSSQSVTDHSHTSKALAIAAADRRRIGLAQVRGMACETKNKRRFIIDHSATPGTPDKLQIRPLDNERELRAAFFSRLQGVVPSRILRSATTASFSLATTDEQCDQRERLHSQVPWNTTLTVRPGIL
jgi:hypothetical protein